LDTFEHAFPIEDLEKDIEDYKFWATNEPRASLKVPYASRLSVAFWGLVRVISISFLIMKVSTF